MRTKLLIPAVLVLLAGGCTVGPNHQRPEVKFPRHGANHSPAA